MERPIQTYIINNPEDLPSEETICAVTIEYKVILQFASDSESLLQSIGKNLKEKLVNHLVAIHTIDPVIKISRLISDAEIVANADFFEQCAKDYKKLATRLIWELAKNLKIVINEDFPSLTFNTLKASKHKGTIDKWNYYIHGFHIHFENIYTGQEIEASIMCGTEFGELDPYFFTGYILSTVEYRSLPVSIYELHRDGERILDKMLELGKLERIPSNWPNRFGIVVKDRERFEIKVFDHSTDYTQKSKFNLLKFLGLKK